MASYMFTFIVFQLSYCFHHCLWISGYKVQMFNPLYGTEMHAAGNYYRTVYCGVCICHLCCLSGKIKIYIRTCTLVLTFVTEKRARWVDSFFLAIPFYQKPTSYFQLNSTGVRGNISHVFVN